MTSTEQDTVLNMTHRFEAPRQRVFDAWTNPDILKRWWRVGPDWHTPEAEVDLRPGGRYRLTMHDPESGDSHTVVGEYTEVHPPQRLAYTWTWEGAPGEMGAESLVVVEFVEDGDATKVVLTHSGFPSTENRDQHAHGWTGCLTNLEEVFSA